MGRILRQTGSEATGTFCGITYLSNITTIYKINCFGKKKLLFSYYKHISTIILDGKEHRKIKVRILTNNK